MNKVERIKLIRAMEFVARQVNNERIFEDWLISGVADGDIEYGDLDVGIDDFDDLEYYIGDEEFADLMSCFLEIMSYANVSGGLYCDDVISS